MHEANKNSPVRLSGAVFVCFARCATDYTRGKPEPCGETVAALSRSRKRKALPGKINRHSTFALCVKKRIVEESIFPMLCARDCTHAGHGQSGTGEWTYGVCRRMFAFATWGIASVRGRITHSRPFCLTLSAGNPEAVCCSHKMAALWILLQQGKGSHVCSGAFGIMPDVLESLPAVRPANGPELP